VLVATLTSCGDDSGALADVPATSSTAPTSAAPATTTTAAPIAPAVTVPEDPCSLVTQEEADRLAGREVLPPEPAGVGSDSPTCTFPTQVTGSIAQVEVFLGPGAQKYLEIDRDTLGHEFTEVAGIGDEAHQEDGAIFFRVDGVWAALRLTTLDDDPDQVVRLQELARVVAARLAGSA
jgi:hypothetical protein